MKKIQRSFTSEEIKMIQELGEKEDNYRLPKHLRLTQWYGDYSMYEAVTDICEGELQKRYVKKLVLFSDYEREDIPAGRNLYGYTWTHHGTGTGYIKKSSSGDIVYKYDFSALLNGLCDNVAAADDYIQVLSEWEKAVQKFVHETEEKVALDTAPEQEFLKLKEQYEQLYRDYVHQKELVSRKKSNLEFAKRIVKYDPKPLANLILNMYYGQTVEDSCSFCEILGLNDKCKPGHCTDCIDNFLRAYYTADTPPVIGERQGKE